MRIGIMLRSWSEKGGIGVYARNVTRELVAADTDHEFVLLYDDPAYVGTFGDEPRVTELALSAPGKILWDQWAVPRACKREGVDVLFHPKFTVPIFSPCPSVMVLHGAGWFMPEMKQFWGRWDLKYVRASMPVYCRRASKVLSVSEITREVFESELGIEPGKIRAVYFAPARIFRRVEDTGAREAVRRKYSLPERFVLSLSGYTKGPRKNIGAVVGGFARHHGLTDHKLVVVGKDCDKFRGELGIPDDGYGADVVFPGYIEQEDLPAIYSMADTFLYPSFVEAFPVPITEALACGVPIVTSDANGLREVAGPAALYLEKSDEEHVARALGKVLTDAELRQELSRKSLERSERYSWEKCVEQTLGALVEVASAK